MKLEGTKLRIVNINGSAHAGIGNTQTLVNWLVEALREKMVDVEIVNHYIVKEKIEQCRGCTRCMRKGDCVQASKDDVLKMVEDLLSADMIVFSSPIYVLNVTGLMKKFLDRTAFMTHRLVLENKIGIYVLSSQGLGVESVAQYMQSVMEAMGVTVIGSINGTAIIHNQFVNADEINMNIKNIISALENEEYKEKISVSNSEIERREKFQSLMEQEDISKKLFHEDYKYWMDRKGKNE